MLGANYTPLSLVALSEVCCLPHLHDRTIKSPIESIVLKRVVEKITKALRSPRHLNQTIGVEFTAEGVSFAVIERSSVSLPKLTHCEFIASKLPESSSLLLAERLSELGITRAPCHLVMTPSQYQLMLGDAPNVPADELAEALRWRLKDVIHFPVADAVVQAFLLPTDASRTGQPMAYAVVAQRADVQKLVSLTTKAQLNLQSIDIPELALRNLIVHCCDTQRAVAVARIVQHSGNVLIVRDQQIYLSRSFALDYNGGLLDDLPENALALELQRSLDYYDRQMRQAQPSSLLFCGDNITADKLTDPIRQSLHVPVGLLSITDGLDVNEAISEHQLSLGLIAIGAALREQEGSV